jgi:hypothetical protein
MCTGQIVPVLAVLTYTRLRATVPRVLIVCMVLIVTALLVEDCKVMKGLYNMMIVMLFCLRYYNSWGYADS